MTAQRNVVSTYRRKGTFRVQAAERTGRASQNTPLPPRCRDCRLPGIHRVVHKTDGAVEFFCEDHVLLGMLGFNVEENEK